MNVTRGVVVIPVRGDARIGLMHSFIRVICFPIPHNVRVGLEGGDPGNYDTPAASVPLGDVDLLGGVVAPRRGEGVGRHVYGGVRASDVGACLPCMANPCKNA